MASERAVFQLQAKSERNFTGYKGTYYFQDGYHVATLDSGKVEKRARVLAAYYGAKRIDDGTGQVPAAPGSGEAEPVLDGVRPPGAGPAQEGAADGGSAAAGGDATPGSIPGGDGHGDTRDDGTQEFSDRLLAAVKGLDPAEDEHWTADGRPRVDAVEKAYGSAGVTRADVERVAPGFTRPSKD